MSGAGEIGAGRKRLLCAQAAPAALTGIDFVLVDPDDHRRLRVVFVIPPDTLARPVDTTAMEFAAAITGLEDGSTIPVAAQVWEAAPDAGGVPRLTLRIDTAEEGGFQHYLLTLTDTPLDGGAVRLDRFATAIRFSFKQGCETPFDCKPVRDCPEEPAADYPVDYLARDFESLRRALLAFASERYPDWSAQVPADFGGMMAELFAALGDEFAYVQDRFQREGYLDSLTQRRSFDQLARLIDTRRDPGQAARGLVVFRPAPGTLPQLLRVAAGLRLFAEQEDGPAVPFETGASFAGMLPDLLGAGGPGWPVHSLWTDLPVYLPDPEAPCLPVGARSLVLASDALLAPPFPAEVLGTDIAGYWEGRQLLIETQPGAPEEPQRRHLVTLDAPAEAIDDPLTGATGLVRLHWRAEDALPFELDQTAARVSANLVPVRAGLTLRAEFATGQGGPEGLVRSVERAGPWQQTAEACEICGTEAAGARPVIHRFTLPATVAAGLGWEAGTDAAGAPDPRPDVALHEAEGAEWQVAPEVLGLGPTSRAVVLEAGHYAPIARFERRGEVYQHLDYAGDAGHTLRFGDGRFGRLPGRGTAFVVHYRTGPGRQANVPANTIRRLDPPPGTPPELVAAPLGLAGWEVRNPFPVTDGRDPQPLEHARRTGAAQARALSYRAVRNADYREQAERLDWVEQARAVTRWTGAWATTFVTADPRGRFEMSAEQTAELLARMGAVRQVGRPVILRQPVFVALDLQIALCTARGHAFGSAASRVLRALGTGPGGFFHPDRFSFGDPLRRPELEAAIAAVEGVAAVLAIRLRPRGQRGYIAFDFPALDVAANRILQVENDPDRPDNGSIRVYAEALPEPEGIA